MQPGKAAASLLSGKLKGLSGDRCPSQAGPSEAVIAKFDKWIAEGRSSTDTTPIRRWKWSPRTYTANVQTHEQACRGRSRPRRKIWRLAIPDDKPLEKETKNFFIIGNVGPEGLDNIATVAEKTPPRSPSSITPPRTSRW